MLRETRTERSVEELRNVIIIPGGDTNKRKQKVKEITECDPRFDSRSLIFLAYSKYILEYARNMLKKVTLS